MYKYLLKTRFEENLSKKISGNCTIPVTNFKSDHEKMPGNTYIILIILLICLQSIVDVFKQLKTYQKVNHVLFICTTLSNFTFDNNFS